MMQMAQQEKTTTEAEEQDAGERSRDFYTQ